MIAGALALPVVLAVALNLPLTQEFFLPPAETIQTLIDESRSRPAPQSPWKGDIEYDRDLFRRYHLDVYAPLDPADSDRRGDADVSRGGGGNGSSDGDGGVGDGGTLLDADAPGGGKIRAAAPVVVFFHGGSWLRGDKITIRIVDRFLRRMRERGWYVVSVNYTTSVLRGLGGPVDQAREAVAWVFDHASEYGWDQTRVGLYGVSAGGHVALMAAETVNAANRPAPPAFVFAECAPTDLVAMREGDAFESSAGFRFFPEFRLETLSPINYVSPATPPVLLFHGDKDRTVHIDQSRRYAAALRAAGGDVTLEEWPGGDHAFLNLSDAVWFEQESVALDWMSRAFADVAAAPTR